MDAIKVIETSPGEFSLLLAAGETDVDDVIETAGHEPNGYFWEGIAELLIATEAPALQGRFEFDSEGGMFAATGSDRPALDELAALLAAVAVDAERVRRLIAFAQETGFEFDD
jgi:hypothetical protein